jgi:hypothetical protein
VTEVTDYPAGRPEAVATAPTDTHQRRAHQDVSEGDDEGETGRGQPSAVGLLAGSVRGQDKRGAGDYRR